jgi:hypothetical protein
MRGGVARLEDEAASGRQVVVERGERLPQFIVAEQFLKGVPGHHDQVERRVPVRGRQVALHPLDIVASRLLEHPRCRVQANQPPGVPGLTRQGQQRSRATANVEDALGGQQQRQIKRQIVALVQRREQVVERSQAIIDKRFVPHR